MPVLQKLLAATALSCLICVAAPARAQDAPAPEEAARFRFGPIRFTPVLNVERVGVDTNVFNEADDPKSDFTAVFGPQANYWMKLGRARLVGESLLQYFYFQQYDSQRSTGTTNRARLEVPLAHLVPFVDGEYTNTRQRTGFEIDTRARRTLVGGHAGLDVLLGGRTRLRTVAGTSRSRFASDDTFVGAVLQERRDRFIVSPGRDADGIRIATGFEFKPFALISGKGEVGYRRFHTLSAVVPDYQGPAASADLAYVLRATRLAVRVEHDVTYSFEALEPYYLLTDVAVSVTQRL